MDSRDPDATCGKILARQVAFGRIGLSMRTVCVD